MVDFVWPAHVEHIYSNDLSADGTHTVHGDMWHGVYTGRITLHDHNRNIDCGPRCPALCY